MKKKQLIIVASLLTLIAVVALGVVLLVNREKPKKTLTLETSTSIASSKAKESSSSTRKQYKDPGKAATETLEKDKNPVEDSQKEKVKQTLVQLIQGVGQVSSKSDVYPSAQSSSLMSSKDSLRELWQWLHDGYQYQENETSVYYSNSGDVYQIVFILSKGEQKVAYSANYLVSTENIQLATYKEGVHD